MRFKIRLIYILFVFAGLFTGLPSYAQNKGGRDNNAQQTLDSIRDAKKAEAEALRAERERIADSTSAARKHIVDSTIASRKHIADSIKLVRDRRSDSLAAIREYKESRGYKDSVENAREARLDSIRTERQLVLDAQRAERDRINDSISAVRDAIRDSIKLVQTERRDSLAAIREYRESKRYKDSVAFVRQTRVDSIAAARKHINDSISAFRQHIRDSTTASRTAIRDSTVAARKVYTDSLTAVRKARSDSLSALREKREKLAKDAAKKREQKMELAIEMKIKSKQKAWSNEKMLKKKWSAPRQLIQNSFTRYNYYFNAHNKMEEAKANMERVSRENLDSFIALYPFNPNRDSTLIAPDMDSIIHKVSLGIQIHDPRTKWADDLYLLLGQAFYYKGDYKNASTSFRYIIGMDARNKKKKSSSNYRRRGEQVSILEEEKEGGLDFLKHKSVNNYAILWLSRTFVRAGQPENAEAVLDLVASDPKFPENLKGRLAMEKAFLMLNDNNAKGAGKELQIAADDEYLSKDERQRAAFLGAQILQQQNEYTASSQNFQKVLDLHADIEMDFYARKNIATNAMASGEERDKSIASLKKILKDYKYSNYYEQVYFLLGRLSAKNGDNGEAVAYLEKSINSPRSTNKQKAISFAALGDIQYLNGDYVAAKTAYDTASQLFKYAPDDRTVIEAVRRSGALASVTGPYLTIKNQDSLLALAALPEKEQRSIIRKHLKDLQRQREDSIFNAENAGLNTINQAQPDFNQRSGGGWYFANVTQMKKGQNEFKRIWGQRPAVDNWRRMSAIGYVSNGSNSSGEESVGEDGLVLDENGLPTEDALLALLPTSPEQRLQANKDIQRAYVDLSDAYITELEDYQLADRALDTLDVRYNQHDEKDRALYLKYLMSVRLNKIPESRSYAQQIQLQFPTSEYAELVKPTEDGGYLPTNSVLKENVSNYYDATYALLMQRQFLEVLERIKIGRQRYKDPRYDKRFRVMEGVALAGAGKYVQADTLLRDFIQGNANDTLRSWAESVLEYVNKNKPVTSTIDTGVKRVDVIDTNTVKPPPIVNTNNSFNGTVEIAKPTGEVPPIFAYKPDVEHYVLISFPGMDSRAMGMKSAVGDFNSFKYKSSNLTSGIDMLSLKEGVVYTQKFPNAAIAKKYMDELRGTTQVFREYQGSEYQLFLISASNYQKLLADHSTSQYLNFYKFYYK